MKRYLITSLNRSDIGGAILTGTILAAALELVIDIIYRGL